MSTGQVLTVEKLTAGYLPGEPIVRSIDISLAEGEVVTDGPVDKVLTGSPAFAPQVAKVLAPQPWLTVAQVQATLPHLCGRVS